MKYKSVLESLDKKLGSDLRVRRYSLSEMISESYRTLYDCKKDTNLQKLVETHLADVKSNPADTDRLSRQLAIIKEVKRLTESAELKDEDLVPKEKYTPVEPPKEDIKESKSDDEEELEESSAKYRWGDWQSERGSSCRVRYYSVGMDLTNQVIGIVYEESEDHPYYGAEIYDNSTATSIEERTDDSYHFDTEEAAMEWVEEWFRSNESSTTDEEDEDLLEDTELTDEEVDELTKHLSELRKNKKVSESKPAESEEEKPVEESTVGKGRPLKKRVSEARDSEFYQPTKEEATTIVSRIQRKYGNEISEQDYLDVISAVLGEDDVSTDIIDHELEKSGIKILAESKTYESLDLSEFRKKSAGKAFIKTFKKMSSQLQEGTELNRQDSISLYKAANSAMTHLSVELEHNPEFLSTFKESVSLLSADVSDLLDSLKEGKSPSKATMQSLAKFVEALLREADEEEELPPVEDEEDADVGAEDSEEATEQFDQEYADARFDLHNELADAHAEESPEIDSKLAQDAEEVASLPGISEEQAEQLLGGESEESPEEEPSAEEDMPEEEVTEESADPEESEEKADLDLGSDDAELTDDELAELKRHLREMRAARNNKA